MPGFSSWLRRYAGGAGSGLGAVLCTVCMGGMWAAMAAAGGMGAAAAAGAFSWVPVAVLRPVSAVLLGLGVLGLLLSRLSHRRWGPLALGVPAAGFVLAIMYGWPRLLFRSAAVQTAYLGAVVLLVVVGLWEFKLARARR